MDSEKKVAESEAQKPKVEFANADPMTVKVVENSVGKSSSVQNSSEAQTEKPKDKKKKKNKKAKKVQVVLTKSDAPPKDIKVEPEGKIVVGNSSDKPQSLAKMVEQVSQINNATDSQQAQLNAAVAQDRLEHVSAIRQNTFTGYSMYPLDKHEIPNPAYDEYKTKSFYKIKFSNKFISNFQLHQSQIGAYYFLAPLKKLAIQKFTDMKGFLLNSLPELGQRLADEYSGILYDLPTVNRDSEYSKWKYNQIDAKHIGMNWEEYTPKFRNLSVQAEMNQAIYALNLKTPYSRYGKYQYANANSFQMPWEHELQSYLSNFEYNRFFNRDENADGYTQINLNKTIDDVYQYYRTMATTQTVLDPKNVAYKGKFVTGRTRVPFVDINNDFAYCMITSPIFRDIQIKRWYTYFYNIFSNPDIFPLEKNTTSHLAAALTASITSYTFANQTIAALDASYIINFLPWMAVVMMFNKVLRFNTIYSIDQRVPPFLIISRILERIFFAKRMVTVQHRWANAVQLVLFLKSFAIDPSEPCWSSSFWLAESTKNTIKDPITYIINKLRVFNTPSGTIDIPMVVYDFLADDDKGSGWASAGQSQVFGNPPASTSFRTSQFSSTYFDTEYVDNFDVKRPLQWERFTRFANALATATAYRVGAPGLELSQLRTVTNALSTVVSQSNYVFYALQTIGKLYYLVSQCPLAMPLTDDDDYNTQYADGSIYWATLSRQWDEMKRYEISEAMRKDVLNFQQLYVEINVDDGFALSLACAACFDSPVNFAFPLFEICETQWQVSYWFTELEKYMMKHFVFTFTDLFGYWTDNIRMSELIKRFVNDFLNNSSVCPMFREDVKKMMDLKIFYLPISTGSMWYDYWTKILKIIAVHNSDFYFSTYYYYGALTFELDNPNYYIYNVYNVDPDLEYDEWQLRNGTNDRTTAMYLYKAKKDGKVVKVKVPVLLDIEAPGEAMSIIRSGKDWKADVLAMQRPISFPEINTSNTPAYEMSSPIMINGITSDALQHQAIIHFMFDPSIMVDDDPLYIIDALQIRGYFEANIVHETEVYDHFVYASVEDLVSYKGTPWEGVKASRNPLGIVASMT